MKLTTKTRYGTRAMLTLALLYGQDEYTSSKDIAASQDVSVKYLEHLLSEMRNAGLVRSSRGAKGGHRLARDPREINLRVIYEALEGSEGLVECTTCPEICDRHAYCVTRDVWSRMYAASMGVLEATTLADLVQSVHLQGGVAADIYSI
jgi:Rrf2 family protein